MQLENNLFGESIDYTQPYLNDLTEDEEKVCADALQDVEDAIAEISKLQSRRKNENGEIVTPLRLDELQRINLNINKLDNNLAVLKLSLKASSWKKQKEESAKSIYTERFLDREVDNNKSAESFFINRFLEQEVTHE